MLILELLMFVTRRNISPEALIKMESTPLRLGQAIVIVDAFWISIELPNVRPLVKNWKGNGPYIKTLPALVKFKILYMSHLINQKNLRRRIKKG